MKNNSSSPVVVGLDVESNNIKKPVFILYEVYNELSYEQKKVILNSIIKMANAELKKLNTLN